MTSQRYELSQIIEEERSRQYPDGIDTTGVIVSDAKDIIKWLLKHDESVGHLLLSRKIDRKKRRSK